MKVFYLPQSSVSLSKKSLFESMRRWHWRQYFLALRRKDMDRAAHHRKLAQSLQRYDKV